MLNTPIFFEAVSALEPMQFTSEKWSKSLGQFVGIILLEKLPLHTNTTHSSQLMIDLLLFNKYLFRYLENLMGFLLLT